MFVVFRADANPTIGSGHIMRSLALANHLKKYAGATCLFISRENGVSFFENKITQLGHMLSLIPELSNSISPEHLPHSAWLPHGQDLDAEFCLKILTDKQKPDWLIIDHYAIGKRWETKMRKRANNILVIDDLADREHDCDILLDQNLGNKKEKYRSLSPNSKLLLGPKYALLREDFTTLARKKIIQKKPINRINICFGGIDSTGHTLATLKAAIGIETFTPQIDIIINKNNKDLGDIKNIAKKRKNISIYVSPNNIAKILSRADLAIGAGGSMSWERSCLGIPSLAIGVANNQTAILSELFQGGYAVGFEYMPHPDEIKIQESIKSLINSPTPLYRIAKRSRSLVDGNGTRRVADLLQKKTHIDILCSDLKHPIIPHLNDWIKRHEGAKLHNTPKTLESGKFLFLISCQHLIPTKIREKYQYTLVIHASDLPKGRGMSPLAWQLLEGKTKIKVSLLEAEDPFDTGRIYKKNTLKFTGTETFEEINQKLFSCELELMEWAINNCDIRTPKKQVGTPTYYTRRSPQDSRIYPEKTIAEQFDAIRIADPERYPAFFDFRGQRYKISLTKLGTSK